MDSVVNTDKTIVKFVQHVRKLYTTIRIVVVIGIIQAQCISGSSTLNQIFTLHIKLYFIILRLSDTKFINNNIIDTGNYLFNTTYLL